MYIGTRIVGKLPPKLLASGTTLWAYALSRGELPLGELPLGHIQEHARSQMLVRSKRLRHAIRKHLISPSRTDLKLRSIRS